MNLSTTLLFYLLIGGGVAVAVHQMWLGAEARNRWFCTCTAIAFWPLYLPALLQPQGSSSNHPPGNDTSTETSPPADELSAAIQQVETELDLALRSLDGWSDEVLVRERDRFAELRSAWHGQAGRIRELDRLLQQPAFVAIATGEPYSQLAPSAANSERGRRANIARLAAVRQRLHNDLLNTLGRVRELVTMIHLAKYTGAPASRAEELVMQISTSIEVLSEVAAWRGDEKSVGFDRD